MNSTVRLEYFSKADYEQLIGWINSEKLLQNWTGSMFTFPLTEEKLDWYIHEANDPETSDALIYKGVDRNNGKTIGHISLGSISRKNRSARISRVLVGETCQRGKGYCQGLINEVLRVGFEDLRLHRISLGVYDFNTAAIKCYERCGFTTEGISRDVLWYNDEFWSLVEMSILENEWRNLRYNKAA